MSIRRFSKGQIILITEYKKGSAIRELPLFSAFLYYSLPEFIDPVFTKTSRKRWFLVIENERFGLVFTKTGSINSGTCDGGGGGGGQKQRWKNLKKKKK